jgi:phytoene synthase
MTTLEESYEVCRRLNRRSGTTYYWSTYLLPRVKRHHVHALYGFCRYADDIVDEAGVADPAGALAAYAARVRTDLASGGSDHPVLKAVVHTVKAFDLDPSCLDRFLRSMTMDLTIDRYETYEDLLDYMDGSAAVIGELMLPILEPVSAEALSPARDLGSAFQLTNFLRDIAEDLDRGRVYLPQEDIRKFDAGSAWSTRSVTPAFVDLLRYEIARTRSLYDSATAGLALLPPASARCIGAAHQLYGEILDRIEAARYDVWSARARVPTWRKAAVAVRGLTGRSIP